jgi:dihydropyrimidinase
MFSFDTVIRNGTVVSGEGVCNADIGVRGSTIEAIGRALPQGAREIDATGNLVLPGGVDTHAHIEQISAAGLRTADDYASATTAAAFGGTTTVLSFAAQHRGLDLQQVVTDYHAAATRGAVIDYGFHLLIADPNERTLAQLPSLVASGCSTVKIFLTYERLILDDERVLEVMAAARALNAMVCVHAENQGMISWTSKRLIAKGKTQPKYHAVAHSREAEIEAINRIIALAKMTGVALMVYHVSTAEGAAAIGEARRQGLNVHGETCPQYLFLVTDDLDLPGNEGAKLCFSPPPRTVDDQVALWRALELGDLEIISSDHAPSAFDETGKLSAGPNPTFKQIPSGVPGIETRMPLLFDKMVSKGHLGVEAFVHLTATQPARLYGLANRKGVLQAGADADIVVWDKDREVALTASLMHDKTGYTPYEGRRIVGWPETVLIRGTSIIEQGELRVRPGFGQFLRRAV